MDITFGKTAYVSGVEDSMLYKMENPFLSISLSGENIVVVTKEAIEEFINSYTNNMEEYQRAMYRPLKTFLQTTLDSIIKLNDDTPIGDIFFSS
jgi:hypothetical protein